MEKCRICGKKGYHIHEQEIITEFFLPDQHNLICHCGKPYVHDHKKKIVAYVHGEKL